MIQLLLTLTFDISIHQEIGMAQARDIQIMSHVPPGVISGFITQKI